LIDPIFPMDTDRGGVEMHGPGGYLVVQDRFHGQFRKEPSRSRLKQEVQHPAHGVVIEHTGCNTFSQKELGVTTFVELHQTIEM